MVDGNGSEVVREGKDLPRPTLQGTKGEKEDGKGTGEMVGVTEVKREGDTKLPWPWILDRERELLQTTGGWLAGWLAD